VGQARFPARHPCGDHIGYYECCHIRGRRERYLVGGVAAALSVIATILTTLNTFLNPSEKESAHLTAARAYDRLNNDALML
jgi:hypothetical protein